MKKKRDRHRERRKAVTQRAIDEGREEGDAQEDQNAAVHKERCYDRSLCMQNTYNFISYSF